jgi:hypothetical protein
MEWWEKIGLVAAWVVGVYLRGKIYEEKNGYKRDDRWGRRNRFGGLFSGINIIGKSCLYLMMLIICQSVLKNTEIKENLE